jgi:SAM-dependent methyltransferase
MSAVPQTKPLDENKLGHIVERALWDAGATLHAGLVVIGDKLGLYKRMAGAGPLTSAELAEWTNTTERYVREWLRAHAAGGYVDYDPATDRYELTPEQALLLADETSPYYVVGAFQGSVGALKSVSEIQQAFRTGRGFGWHQHDSDLFHGTEKLFRPSYVNHLTSKWIPSLAGVEAKLKSGAKVADIACGYGASTIIMAQAYPESTITGFDFHEPSIRQARRRAEEAGVADRVQFQVGKAQSFDGGTYDLVTTFDALHDMGDPAGAARHVKEILKEDGVWMIVEPFAGDNVEQNLTPIGRIYYGASTLICVPCSLNQEVARGLGAQAGEAQIREVVTAGGFTQFRRATETHFNLVFEAKV